MTFEFKRVVFRILIRIIDLDELFQRVITANR